MASCHNGFLPSLTQFFRKGNLYEKHLHLKPSHTYTHTHQKQNEYHFESSISHAFYTLIQPKNALYPPIDFTIKVPLCSSFFLSSSPLLIPLIFLPPFSSSRCFLFRIVCVYACVLILFRSKRASYGPQTIWKWPHLHCIEIKIRDVYRLFHQFVLFSLSLSLQLLFGCVGKYTGIRYQAKKINGKYCNMTIQIGARRNSVSEIEQLLFGCCMLCFKMLKRIRFYFFSSSSFSSPSFSLFFAFSEHSVNLPF